MTDLDQLKTDALTRIENAPDAAALEALRIEFLGKQGSISGLMKTLGKMSPEERQVQGPLLNGLRTETTDAIAARKAVLEEAELEARLATESLDLTLPAPEAPRGSVHPVSQVMDELAEIFADLGFSVATGPEIEDDWHNFTALNMAETHPARAMHDTFYFPDVDSEGRRMLLRTHTSPVQIRAMVEQGAPLRIIAPGRVYRSDSDATHTPMFHQIEGLVIDRYRAAPAPLLLPLHRTLGRGRCRLAGRQWPARSRRRRRCAGPWLDGAARQRHGQPPRDRNGGARPR